MWQRLAAFEIDEPGVALPFSRRLAREQGWHHEFALAAIEEYRRFVYLAMVAGHPVTPSDAVDQVWHLHLCYTRSYWEDLCGKVLPRPLHHGPTRGGSQEGAKFDGWYRATLASYEQVFSQQPPARLWPAPELRFQRRSWQRVDLADSWLLSRRRLRRQALAAVVTLSLLSVAGCTSWLGHDVGLLVVVLAVAGMVFLMWHLIRHGGGGRGTGGGNGTDGSACGFSHHGDGDHADGDGGGDAGCGDGCGGCGD